MRSAASARASRRLASRALRFARLALGRSLLRWPSCAWPPCAWSPSLAALRFAGALRLVGLALRGALRLAAFLVALRLAGALRFARPCAWPALCASAGASWLPCAWPEPSSWPLPCACSSLREARSPPFLGCFSVGGRLTGLECRAPQFTADLKPAPAVNFTPLMPRSRCLTGLRVAPGAGLALGSFERTEPGKLDIVASCDRRLDALDHLVEHVVDILLRLSSSLPRCSRRARTCSCQPPPLVVLRAFERIHERRSSISCARRVARRAMHSRRVQHHVLHRVVVTASRCSLTSHIWSTTCGFARNCSTYSLL